MPTLRTHIINANNTKALPPARYHLQQYNSLQQCKEKHMGIQPLRYVNVIKQVLTKDKKTHQKVQKSETKEANQLAKNPILSSENTWKKGHGTIERIDKKTGDIFHLIRTTAKQEAIRTPEDTANLTTTAKTKDSVYTSHLIRVKTPLKLYQKTPSQVVPQSTNKKIAMQNQELIPATKKYSSQPRSVAKNIKQEGFISKIQKRSFAIFDISSKFSQANKKIPIVNNCIS